MGLALVGTENILTPATPVQGRITASNSNTSSRQILIHIAYDIGFLFFQPLFRAGTTFHWALRKLTV